MERQLPPSTLFPYTSSSDLVERESKETPETDYKGGLVLPALGLHFPGAKDLNAPKRYMRYRLNRIAQDRKSTRLNSSHPSISYAVFCLKKKSSVFWSTHADS